MLWIISIYEVLNNEFFSGESFLTFFFDFLKWYEIKLFNFKVSCLLMTHKNKNLFFDKMIID